jgi:hypothetical protein
MPFYSVVVNGDAGNVGGDSYLEPKSISEDKRMTFGGMKAGVVTDPNCLSFGHHPFIDKLEQYDGILLLERGRSGQGVDRNALQLHRFDWWPET